MLIHGAVQDFDVFAQGQIRIIENIQLLFVYSTEPQCTKAQLFINYYFEICKN